MRIGLIRHFKVKIAYPEKRFLTPAEVYLWFQEYDRAEIEAGDFDLA